MKKHISGATSKVLLMLIGCAIERLVENFKEQAGRSQISTANCIFYLELHRC